MKIPGVKNVVGKIGQIGGNILSKGASVGGNILSKAGGIASKGAGVVASKVGGFASKIFGPAAKVVAPALKTAMPAVKGFAKRIPILGPIIVAVASLMSGEPIGQALFKAVGAGLGGALGTFIPIPVLGTLIGETIGVYVGDLMYDLILGGGPAAAGQRLKEESLCVKINELNISDVTKKSISLILCLKIMLFLLLYSNQQALADMNCLNLLV